MRPHQVEELEGNMGGTLARVELGGEDGEVFS